MIAEVIRLPPPAELRELHGMASFDDEAKTRAAAFAKALGVPVELVLLVRTEEKP